MRPLSFLCFWLLAASVGSQPLARPVEPRLDREAILQRGIACLHRGVFDSVLIASAALHARDPDDPVSPFLAADAYNTMTRDYRVRRFEAQFDSLITQTVITARKALKRRPTAENYFLLGSAEGYRCFYLFRRGEWLKAINAAMTCLDNLRIALELNPKLVDPLLGLAMYDYGKSKIPGLGRLHLSALYRSLGEPNNACKALTSARMYAGRYQAHEEIDGSYTTFEETARAIARATQQEKIWAQRH